MDTIDGKSVQIWYLNTQSLDCAVEKLASQYLSPEETERCDRFRFAADRRDFVIAHDLLRRALSRYGNASPAEWQFVTNEYGRPVLATNADQAQPLAFSLTHTQGCVACAITTGAPVGIDVETIRRSTDALDVAHRYFSIDERTWLSQCGGPSRSILFTELWTLKEAFLKAIGTGLAGLPANGISIRYNEKEGIEFSTPPGINFKEWHLALFAPTNNVRIGLAVRNSVRSRFLMRDDAIDGPTLSPVRVSASP